MADFDLDGYFAQRIGTPQPDALNGVVPNPTATAGPQTDKIADLQRASSAKLQDLSEVKTLLKARQLQQAGSWAGKLGLEEDSFLSNRVNDAASLVSGASRLAGQVVSLPLNAQSLADETTVNEAEIQAYNRYKAGTATEADVDLLTTAKAMAAERDTPEAKALAQAAADRNPDAPTPLSLIERAGKARNRARKVNEFFDLSSIVDQTNRNELTDQLGSEFKAAWSKTTEGMDKVRQGELGSGSKEAISGIADLLMNAGDAVSNNPAAAREYILENAPQLAVGAVRGVGKALLGSSNVGYAADNYQQGIENYQKANNGAYPPEDIREYMALHAASLAVAEQLGDVSLLKGIVPTKSADDVVRTGLKESLKNTGKAASTGLVTEAVTEGYQTYAEGEAKLKSSTPEEIYTGAVIGGVAGGGMSAGGRGAAELLKATPEHAKLRELDAGKAAVLDKAISTGDVSAYTDSKAKTYAPERAVAALFGNTQLDTTTPEAKQENLTKATEIVAKLEEQRVSLKEAVDEISPAAVENYKTQLEKYTAEQATVDVQDTKRVAELSEGIAVLKELIADGSSKKPKQLQRELDQLDTRLNESRQSLEQINLFLKPADTDVETLVQEANVAPTPEQPVPAAVEKVINLSMATPESLDPAVATELADNETNALTVDQRAYLRAFSEARVAENRLKDMGKVSQEVFAGSDKSSPRKYIGIAQYRARMAEAMAGANQPGADRQLAGLTKFKMDHEAKLSVAEAAMAQGPGKQIIRSKDGQWMVSPTRLSDKEIRDNGGLTLNSPELVSNMRAEVDALVKVEAEMRSAYKVQFGKQTPKKSVVQSAPQQKTSPPSPNLSTKKDVEEGTRLEKVPPDSPLEAPSPKVEEEKTVKVTDPVEEPATVTTPVVESGTLSALQDGNKSPEGTAYHLVNLLGSYFKQALNRDGNTSVRPLVATKDFISSLVNKTTTVGEFLADKTLNDQQKFAVRSFVKHAREWQARIKANLPALAPQEYRHQDMMQFLLEEQSDGSVDVAENVKTAMAYAAYSWAAEQASAPRRLTDKAINAVLGRQKGTRISAMAYKLLGTAGTYQHNVVDSLGGKVLDALGLEANKDTPQNVIAQLRTALGGHTMKLLEDEGLATRTTISGWDIQALREEGLSEKQVERLRAQSQGVNHHLAHTFFAVARDGKGNLMEKVKAISEANKGTKAVLSKLFQVESGHKVPSLEPVTQVQNTTSGTNQGLPTELKKILLANQARPRVVRKDKLALFDGFNNADRNAMLGVVEIDDATTHIVNRPGTQAKNEGLIREYDLFVEFVGEYLATSDKGLDTQFFLEFSAWKQQRVGIATNVANPQASKIVRFLIGSPDWTTKIESTNEELMNSFWLRVAEGLGIKTERADNAVSIEEVQAQLEASVYTDAIQALRKKVVRNKTLTTEEALTTEEQSSIVAAVVKGGANLHTLDALIGVARQQEAKAGNEGNYTFTVEMMGEVDGVANGTMLNHVLMGAGPSVADLNTMLNQGGFYQEGSEHTQYNQWRGAEGNLDIYESTGRKVFNAVKQFVAKAPSDVGQKVNSIWAIAGNIYDESTDSVTKDGRNLVKDGMNPLAFGSSLPSVINVGSSRVDLQACKLEYSIVSPK